MSTRVAPMRAPQADLWRALHHARQHDVHDADAADQQRNRRERHHHDVEDALGALLLGEQLRRNDQRVVAGAAMAGLENAADDRGRRRRCRPRCERGRRCRRSRRAASSSCLRAAASRPTSARRSGCCGPAPAGRRRSLCATACGPTTPITSNHCSLTFTNCPIGIGVAEQPPPRRLAEHADGRGARRFVVGDRSGPRVTREAGDLLVDRARRRRRPAVRVSASGPRASA